MRMVYKDNGQKQRNLAYRLEAFEQHLNFPRFILMLHKINFVQMIASPYHHRGELDNLLDTSTSGRIIHAICCLRLFIWALYSSALFCLCMLHPVLGYTTTPTVNNHVSPPHRHKQR